MNKSSPVLIHLTGLMVTLVTFGYLHMTVEPKHWQVEWDAARYLKYTYNLLENDTFSLTEPGEDTIEPGNANTPLYPAFVSVITRFDDELRDSIYCIAWQTGIGGDSNCDYNVDTLVIVQYTIVIIALIAVWYAALKISGSALTAWLSVIFTLGSNRLIYYAHHFLTESLLTPVFCVFFLFLVLALKSKRLLHTVPAAFSLGLLALIRPEYDYLFLFMMLSLGIYALFQMKKKFFIILFGFVISYYAVIGPWTARNIYHFDNHALTDGYAHIILSQRVSYNEMSWAEWGVFFLYTFPDFGDSVTEAVFPEEYYKKLGMGSGTYYANGVSITNELNAKFSSKGDALDYLIREEILGNLYKHVMVSIPLFWQGIFIEKYWGLLGLICYLTILFKYTRENSLFIIASIPAWFIVALHAFVSFNVQRYNLILIPVYGISIGIILSLMFKSFKPALYNKITNP